jgi:hypothetical protein
VLGQPIGDGLVRATLEIDFGKLLLGRPTFRRQKHQQVPLGDPALLLR